MSRQFPRLKEFIAFVNERQAIHERRLSGKSAPWTKDVILQKYRFTNVRREDDRVTRWIHEHWIHGHEEDPDLWFAFYISRVFNKPETLAAIGWPLPWSAATQRRAYAAIKRRQENGERVFSGAYLVTSVGRAVTSKAEYYMEVFGELWARRKELRPVGGDTLDAFCTRLLTQHGIGGFMAAQVVADAKQYNPLRKATDWDTFARKGPGSHRGLNWVCGRDQHTHWNEVEWHDTLMSLGNKMPMNLDAQNLQNCLCEFSKYCKVKYLGGRAKQKFRPDARPYVSL